MPMFAAKQIECTVCGADFSFSAEEQEFYHSKGFQDPRKCKPCRTAAKQSRGGRGGYGNGGRRNGIGRPSRMLYDAVCSSCGVETQVPFQPSGTKPIYCRDCYYSSSQASY